MNREELCWLAGWLEGEGTFYYINARGNCARLIIQAFSTDRDVIEKVASLLNGRINYIKPRARSNGGFRTEAQAEPAAILMRTLLPFMGMRRREQIRVALHRWETRPNRPVEKLCACGCGQKLVGGIRAIYARETHGACAQRAYRARQVA